MPTSWEPFCDGSGVAGTVGGGIDGGTDGSCVESWVAICTFCCAVKSGNSPWLALGTAGTGAGAAGALESWVRSITGRWLCSGKASKSWDQMDRECVTWIYMYIYNIYIYTHTIYIYTIHIHIYIYTNIYIYILILIHR